MFSGGYSPAFAARAGCLRIRRQWFWGWTRVPTRKVAPAQQQRRVASGLFQRRFDYVSLTVGARDE
eukprot:5409867-Lingulodinium_polyedra.AAC.1